MAPVTKRTQEQGQISIFFSASLVVLISIVALVINIGLFVKAKINLQNATDAAAFSGAAVQARQLTTISYLNWEMRNIYKEWMYKYWVIGNMNIEDVSNPTGDDTMSFRLEADRTPFPPNTPPTEDPYNIPAVCVHLASSQTNICKRYAIPGLPEFGAYNLPGPEEASRNFMDVLIGSKINDCIDRTRLNMLVASTWAYNVMVDQGFDQTLAGQGPAILANRQGAWPKAIELAMRMRNLERAMNREAVTSSVCNNPGGFTSQTNCSQSITDFTSERRLGNERLVKAFYSGYRNLGGGARDESGADEFKESFTLTEIAPKIPNLGNPTGASFLLVPQQYQKQYLDLKLMMVNFAVFYAAMIPRANSRISGACDVSKVAIPVPGYPLGFYKNPDVLTYYAVKGEAQFIGMFNPFGGEAIKLTTYAAAKPFGGRVGPILFYQKPGESFFLSRGRADGGKARSIPYITSLDLVGTPKRGSSDGLALGEYTPGAPLPINANGSQFWLRDEDQPLGGLPLSGDVQFGIPNMVYDYQTPFSNEGYSLAAGGIHKIVTREQNNDQAVGLYSKQQFAKFKGPNLSGEITQLKLEQEIARIKAPTLYETSNYMVPSPGDFNSSQNVDSFGFISGRPEDFGAVQKYQATVYAPLYSQSEVDVLWTTPQEVVSTVFEFMRAQKPGIDKYRRALITGAKAISDMKTNLAGTALGSADQYDVAARGVANPPTLDPTTDAPMADCTSIAGSFLHFYYGAGEFGYPYVTNKDGCPTPLGDLLRTYFNSTAQDAAFSASHYKMEYSFKKEDAFENSPHNPKSWTIFSAYMPGPMSGVRDDGSWSNPIAGSNFNEVMRRNFYSTKFVSLDSLRDGGGYSENVNQFAIYSEGDTTNSGGEEGAQTGFLNSLDTSVPVPDNTP